MTNKNNFSDDSADSALKFHTKTFLQCKGDAEIIKRDAKRFEIVR